ncbi:MAG: hypothetical protein M0C28_31335 [Candidatus Moduliflexus flocculans]|nr:hypothetical protein [Candidatus Moduliflexus flocculans]
MVGVVAKDADGRLVTAKARKGVLMSCGGYESNMEMNRNFNGSEEVYNTRAWAMSAMALRC